MRGWAWLILLTATPLQAEVYKCTVNGQTEFSDQPCSRQPQTITIETRQPDQQAIETQQAITARFEEESRVNQIHELHEKNDVLEAKIEQLQQERQTDLDSLRQRTYRTDDGRIGTREHGLFEKMNQLDADYQQRIRTLRQQIEDNRQQLKKLYK